MILFEHSLGLLLGGNEMLFYLVVCPRQVLQLICQLYLSGVADSKA